MDQLRFTGLHEDGAHLVVTALDGADFAVPIDDRLRTALRQSAGAPTARTRAVTPREVQTQIRAGLSNADVAALTGWEVERVQRYEGPILAEREHIAGLARQSPVRTHERSGPPPTLEARVRDRLHVRGVDLDKIQWDAMRPDGGQWSVLVRFMAGQRIRQAAWAFDLTARSVDAIDDEARWLSEDEQSLPAGAPASALFGAGMDGPDDLMSTMRERSRRRGQGQGRQRKGSATGEQSSRPEGDPDGAPEPEGELDSDLSSRYDGEIDVEVTDVEVTDDGESTEDTEPSADPASLPAGITNQALPLEDLAYDPDTMGPPPAAGREASDVHEEESREGDVQLVEDEGPDDSREATLADFFGSDDDFDDDDDDDSDPDGAEPDAADLDAADPDAEEDRSERGDPQHDGPTTDGSKGDDLVEVTDEVAPASSAPRGRKGRPSVPSWDDIMFGARDKDR